MDWQLLLLSFLTVFISELGDKSQIAAVALGGTSRFPLAVFLGTATALMLTSIVGVMLGFVLGQGSADLVPTTAIKIAAALGFSILGGRLLWESFAEEDAPQTSEDAGENLDELGLSAQESANLSPQMGGDSPHPKS
jgi:putative Ca2+/H+ antiporter (TMEM165/GDT1 family)